MSGTTITFTGTTNPSDWNTAGNWSSGVVPNSPTVTAIDNNSGAALVISGGSSDVVGTLDIGTTGYGVFVGGSGAFGGTGSGTLTATTINAPTAGGVLVGVQGSTINATTITGTDIGGGGTFNGSINDSGGFIVANGGDYGLGTLTLNGGSIVGTGGLQVHTGSALELNDTTSQNISVVSGAVSGPATVQFDNTGAFTGSVVVPTGSTLDVVLPGSAITSASINAGNTLVVDQSGTTRNIALSGTGLTVGTNVLVSTAPVCFARGTRITTPDGEIAVEDLREGDLVTTASGEARKVLWIGHRRADCRRHPEPRKVWPVRIKAGAFGPGLPARDLRVSPQHGIYAEDVLIPAKILVNGSTVVQEQVPSIEYFHIELERHEILLAEGLPSESYLDTGDRASFENGGGALVLHPDFARWAWSARACAELKVIGPEVDRVRARLAANAKPAAASARRRRAETVA